MFFELYYLETGWEWTSDNFNIEHLLTYKLQCKCDSVSKEARNWFFKKNFFAKYKLFLTEIKYALVIKRSI